MNINGATLRIKSISRRSKGNEIINKKHISYLFKLYSIYYFILY